MRNRYRPTKISKISHICNKVGVLLYYEAKADIGSEMGKHTLFNVN